MKFKITIVLVFLWGILIGQPTNDEYFMGKVKIIALDTNYYTVPSSHYLNSYIVLLEILADNYDSVTFCRRRFIATYYSKFCDIEEQKMYEVTLRKGIYHPDKETLIETYEGLLEIPLSEVTLCYDPIFYINSRIKYIITKHLPVK
jgi:hypothetical protein